MKKIDYGKTVKFFQEQGFPEKEAREAATWCHKQLKKIQEKTQKEIDAKGEKK